MAFRYDESMSNIPTISVSQAKDWLDAKEALLIDVRELEEYEDIAVEDAYLLPLSQFSPLSVPQNPDKKILFMCKVGGRSGKACALSLQANPDLDAYNIEGGILAWQEAGFALK